MKRRRDELAVRPTVTERFSDVPTQDERVWSERARLTQEWTADMDECKEMARRCGVVEAKAKAKAKTNQGTCRQSGRRRRCRCWRAAGYNYNNNSESENAMDRQIRRQ